MVVKNICFFLMSDSVPTTKKSAIEAIGTMTWVKTFIGTHAPGPIVGARTKAKTPPVKVIDTVPMYLITYHQFGILALTSIKISPTSEMIANAILLWMVKYMNTDVPPMNEPVLALALKMVPVIANTITMIFSAIEIYFFTLSQYHFLLMNFKDNNHQSNIYLNLCILNGLL